MTRLVDLFPTPAAHGVTLLSVHLSRGATLFSLVKPLPRRDWWFYFLSRGFALTSPLATRAVMTNSSTLASSHRMVPVEVVQLGCRVNQSVAHVVPRILQAESLQQYGGGNSTAELAAASQRHSGGSSNELIALAAQRRQLQYSAAVA